ncbi:MAG: hypothetical protein HKN52_09210 [Eudoraea sp.]|nr:hypothetical protein [Eudoraea sp.]
MKINQLYWLLLCGILLSACTKDEDSPIDTVDVETPNFKLIGEDLDNIYQFSYNASLKQGVQVNLTESLGVDPVYLTLRQVSDVISFYSFSSGSFSVIQQNVETGQSSAYPEFYTVSDERSIIWGTNSEDALFLGYFSPQGSSNLGLRTINPGTQEFSDLPIAFNVEQVFDPVYHRQRLIVSYQDAVGNYQVGIFNTATGAFLQTFDFGSDVPSILIDDMGDIGIIVGKGNTNFTYQVYDIETLNPIIETDFTLNKYLPPGPLKGAVINDILYYTNFLAQTSSVPFGPAYYDFVLDENNVIDIVSIVQQVELETQFTVDVTAMRYLESAGVFLMGYVNVNTAVSVEGGILIISKEGVLLDRVEVPFAPTYIIKP